MVKYCLVTCEGCHFPDLIKEKISRPGCYQWFRAFSEGKHKGEVRHMNTLSAEDYKNYDVIHANICGTSAKYVPQIKKYLAGTDIPLIVNLDYAIETFQQSFPRPKELWDALRIADFVFAQEPVQQAFLTFFFKHHVHEKQDKVPALVPHPCDTKGMKQFRVDLEDRMDAVAVMCHRYRDQLIIPAILSYGLKALSYGFGITQGNIPIGLFNFAAPMMDWGRYFYVLAQSTVALDYYGSLHSHSRFCEETATLAVPTVATNFCYTATKLYPETLHDPWDYEGIRVDLERLVDGSTENGESKNREFYHKIQETAFKKVEYFNWKNSRNRLLEGMRKWKIKI